MADHPHKKSKGPRATLPASKSVVAAKIKKVKGDSPGLTNKQAVGKALGILRNRK